MFRREWVTDGFPFELPGQQTISLSREYQGETIHIEAEPSSLVTGDPCLEFGISAYADEIVIDSFELDENLQKAFHMYFLPEYMVNKEHRECTNWLKNLKKFVEA
ncbi:hypothetical protein L6452_08147 [Arctium lappa]|uniref:Uncharacterized protein n=1 Tax=Arctium lappa TaxID=4217 RepID=A0ACB9DGX6_ARCLA|nr:hypothetical protein L6452_08147 [Arctium lappa]